MCVLQTTWPSILFPKLCSPWPAVGKRELWEHLLLACTIDTIDADCALRSETGCAEFVYFYCYFKIDAPRALVFRPLVKGNEALVTRLSDHTIASCPTWPAATNASPVPSPSSARLGYQAITDNVTFPSSLTSPNQITIHTNTAVSSVNILRSSSRLSLQADCVSPSDKCLPRGQLNLSASHAISAVIRHIICSKHTKPNAFGARIVVLSCLNLPAWQAGLTNYHDSVVTLFLAHGWPVNYCLSFDPIPVNTNHSSAVNFAQTVDSFIATELSHEATAGPFKHDPIPLRLQTSPLQTVDKDKTKCRIVLDLSFPPGWSVNDGIPKDTFLDIPFHLTLPWSADFVKLILSKGPGSFLYKKDLKHAYRQIPVDLKDYKFLSYKWRDNYY